MSKYDEISLYTFQFPRGRSLNVLYYFSLYDAIIVDVAEELSVIHVLHSNVFCLPLLPYVFVKTVTKLCLNKGQLKIIIFNYIVVCV